MKQNAVVFDLDGTLVDSLPDLAAALAVTLGEIGAPALSREAVRGMIGDGTTALVARALAARNLPATLLGERLTRFLALYEAAPATLSRPYPGVRETLHALQDEGRRLAICTNKPQRATLAVLRGLDLEDFFAAIVGGDVLAVKKPDPAHLLAALDRLGAAPGDAIMIGDNEHDVAMAKAAGVPVILVRYGYHRVPLATLAADIQIDAFDALPQAIVQLEAATPSALQR
ncbi:MAG TPA: phosphoglycolate phosphatase [Stellaceae bacterium]|nr:phosphoglycolate phosphatase [Stellaceae bacterium]